MAEEYERRRVVLDDMEGPLGEDGPVEVGEVRDRGLFGRRHGHRSDYYDEADVYGSELGGRRPGVVYEDELGGGYGGGYGSRPPPGASIVYDGVPYGGGYGDRPPVPPEVVYVEGAGYDGGRYGNEGAYGRRPDVVYVEPAVGEASDLGAGLIDSNIRAEPDYGSSLTRPDLAGGVPVGVYGPHGRHGYVGDVEEFEEERRHKRYAEEAAVAALGYGLHERHERKEAEERLEELGYDGDGRRRHGRHHLFRQDS